MIKYNRDWCKAEKLEIWMFLNRSRTSKKRIYRRGGLAFSAISEFCGRFDCIYKKLWKGFLNYEKKNFVPVFNG